MQIDLNFFLKKIFSRFFCNILDFNILSSLNALFRILISFTKNFLTSICFCGNLFILLSISITTNLILTSMTDRTKNEILHLAERVQEDIHCGLITLKDGCNMIINVIVGHTDYHCTNEEFNEILSHLGLPLYGMRENDEIYDLRYRVKSGEEIYEFVHLQDAIEHACELDSLYAKIFKIEGQNERLIYSQTFGIWSPAI